MKDKIKLTKFINLAFIFLFAFLVIFSEKAEAVCTQSIYSCWTKVYTSWWIDCGDNADLLNGSAPCGSPFCSRCSVGEYCDYGGTFGGVPIYNCSGGRLISYTSDPNSCYLSGYLAYYAGEQAIPNCCGNGACESGENCSNCPSDCGSCPAIPVNGACAATHYNCSAGTLGATAEYATQWQWWCNGSNGGTNVLCSEMKIPPPTNFSATCSVNGTPASFSWTLPTGYTLSYFRITDTTTGTNPPVWIPENVADSGPSTSITTIPGHSYNAWIHTRVPSGGYSDAVSKSFTCPIPPPRCLGSDPQNADLCPGDDAGISADLSKISVSVCTASRKCEYVCRSGNNLINGICVAPVNGACGQEAIKKIFCQKPTADLCSKGTATGVTFDGGYWKWTCKGINGSSVNEACQAIRSCAYREVAPN